MPEGEVGGGALFEIDGDLAVPSEITRGPWDPRAMHGGPPSALLARAVEQFDLGPADFLARLTVELLRPVPLEPLRISARTLRPGKMVHWVEAIASVGEVEVARAVGLRLRTGADSPVAVPPIEAFPGPDAGTTVDLDPNMVRGVGFWNANVIRMVSGVFGAARRGRAVRGSVSRFRSSRVKRRRRHSACWPPPISRAAWATRST